MTDKLGPQQESEIPEAVAEVGKRIEAAISRAGTLRQAAEHAGVSTDTMAAWRDGKAEPRFNGLAALARATGLSLDWLAFGQDSAPVPPVPVSPPIPLGPGEVNALLDAIYDDFENMGEIDLPLTMDQVRADAKLLDYHDKLQAIAARATLPPDIRTRADTFLRLLYGDEAAADRHEARMKDSGKVMREARQQIADAARQAGFVMPKQIEQQILSLVLHNKMTGEIQFEDLTLLADAIRSAMMGKRR